MGALQMMSIFPNQTGTYSYSVNGLPFWFSVLHACTQKSRSFHFGFMLALGWFSMKLNKRIFPMPARIFWKICNFVDLKNWLISQKMTRHRKMSKMTNRTDFCGTVRIFVADSFPCRALSHILRICTWNLIFISFEQ